MGTRVRHIQSETKIVDGKKVVVPVLDKDGNEIEIYSIAVPPEVVHEGGDAIAAHVQKQLAAPVTPKSAAPAAAPSAGGDSQ